MTRASMRGRLEALEDAHRAQTSPPELIRLWWADVGAGLWREGVGGEKEEGQTMPMTPEEVQDVRSSGEHRVMLTGLPVRGRK